MKRCFVTLLFTGFLSVMHGQEVTALDSALLNITKQLFFFPHEKIYLHTDKPYYITGEKIFFRAFLLDALSQEQITHSRYVYVELINPVDTVVCRVKIRHDDDSLFHGAIPIPEALPQGTYEIRAYTQYMANQGESAYFSKYVRIGDPGILSIQTYADFQFTGNGRISATLSFFDTKKQEALHPKEVILKMNQDDSFTQRPDREGRIRFNLRVPDNSSKRALYVELKTDQRVYRQYIRIPYPEGDFDVSFHPEGGHLIEGQPSTVAFKAINTFGAAHKVEGEVLDSKGNAVAEIKTIHEGMGQFSFIPLSDERYHAVCRDGEKTRRFDLPEVQTNAVALKAFVKDNKLWIAVNKSESVPCPELYLLIHSRGFVNYAKAWDADREFIAFDVSVFPSGINHLVLLTKDMQAVSERLVFLLNDNDFGVVALQSDKDSYSKREHIRAGIQLKDAQFQPLRGSFSIAITNDRDVAPDTLCNILSEIVLGSELKGTIENPAYYFRKGDKDAEIAADLLMKTHGWTRYAIPDILRGEISLPIIKFEAGHELTGTVKNGWLAKPVKDFKVSILSTERAFIFNETVSDENGRFLFQGLEFPDSTRIVIQSRDVNDKGERMIELHVDEEVFPFINSSWKESVIVKKKEEKKEEKESDNQVFMNYIAKAERQYTNETGMKEYNLPEVLVTANYKERYAKSLYPYTEPDYSYPVTYLKNIPAKTTVGMLNSLIGINTALGTSVRVFSGSDINNFPPLIVIDDMWFKATDCPPGFGGIEAIDRCVSMTLNSINVEDIEQIDIIKDFTKRSFWGEEGQYGVIMIYTNKRSGEKYIERPNVKRLMPLGYQMPVEFYSPKYDTPERINSPKPDLRTTIYWKANAVTDNDGNINLDFYTSDDPSTYTVIIEGVSDDGRLIHYRGNAIINVK